MNERLSAYRQEALSRAKQKIGSPKRVNWTKAFFEVYPELPLTERQARTVVYSLKHEPVYLYEYEQLAGQIYQCGPGSGSIDYSGCDLDPRWADYAVDTTGAKMVRERLPENEMFVKYTFGGAIPGHVTWDYGMILNRGVDELLDEVEGRLSQIHDPKSIEFYKSVIIVLEGVRDWVKEYARALRKAGRNEQAEICERVPVRPARTFREAVQSFWFQYLAVMYENPFGGNGPGRLDWYLWPFLEADLAAGRTTLEEARELITELFIKIDERIHEADGWVEAITVGGRNPDGTSAINPLSSIMIEVIMELKLTHPSVYVRIPDDSPKEFVDLATRYMIESGNRAQFFGDDAIISAQIAEGTEPADARHWAAGGCMEVGVQGMSGDYLWSFVHNVAITFELSVNGGKRLLNGEKVSPHEEELCDYKNFEEVYAGFEKELERQMSILLRRLDIYLEACNRCRPSFLLSTMTHNCLERGRTLNEGGAKYPNYGGSGTGIPNVGDSLYAIKKAVFDEKRYTGKEILEALRANFVGYETMRSYLRNLPKYGGGNEEATAMTDRVLQTFSKILRRYRTPFGGHGRPVILGFVFSVYQGKDVGAMPDGRLATTPLSQGMSPQSGAAVQGITAAIDDATSLTLENVSGGASMMWDIDPFWAKSEFVGPVLRAFIKKGGHIFQGNVTSADELIEAQKNPEGHEDLMVRVGGFSARFCNLERDLQNEIIGRYRYKK
jgi:formate C-acetyltransferase